jgi:hypothetical protein
LGILAATNVPVPRRESMNMLPPAASNRSFIICSPK